MISTGRASACASASCVSCVELEWIGGVKFGFLSLDGFWLSLAKEQIVINETHLFMAT